MAGGIDAVDALAVAFQLTAFETPAAAPTMAASAATRGSPSWPTPTGERQQHEIPRPLLRPAAAPARRLRHVRDHRLDPRQRRDRCHPPRRLRRPRGRARSGNIGKGITITAGRILGVAVLGLATGTTATDIGNWLVHLVRAS